MEIYIIFIFKIYKINWDMYKLTRTLKLIKKHFKHNISYNLNKWHHSLVNYGDIYSMGKGLVWGKDG